MRVKNDDFLNGPVYWKFITVEKLIELLQGIENKQILVNAQSIAYTGNLGMYETTRSDIVGTVDIGDEKVEWYNA